MGRFSVTPSLNVIFPPIMFIFSWHSSYSSINSFTQQIYIEGLLCVGGCPRLWGHRQWTKAKAFTWNLYSTGGPRWSAISTSRSCSITDSKCNEEKKAGTRFVQEGGGRVFHSFYFFVSCFSARLFESSSDLASVPTFFYTAIHLYYFLWLQNKWLQI